MASIVEQLKTIRGRAKLSQAAVGRKLGVSRIQAGRIENGGSSTPIEKVEAWANACDHELVLVDRRAPSAEVLASELAHAEEDQRALLLRISRLLPLLDDRMARIFASQIDMLEEDAEARDETPGRTAPSLKVIGD